MNAAEFISLFLSIASIVSVISTVVISNKKLPKDNQETDANAASSYAEAAERMSKQNEILQGKVNELSQAISDMTLEYQRKDERLKQVELSLAEARKSIELNKSLQRMVTELSAQVTQLTDALEQKDRRVKELEAVTVAQEKRIQELEAEVVTLINKKSGRKADNA